MTLQSKEFAWDNFEAETYFKNNYSIVREHNEKIVTTVAQYLSKHAQSDSTCFDVGTGTNLYPLILTCPWAQIIDIYEPAESNRNWLDQELNSNGERWSSFWKIAFSQISNEQHPHIDQLAWSNLKDIVQKHTGGFNLLPSKQYDIGTMFFVSESATSDNVEFKEFNTKFLNAIKPNGIAVSAFMLGSEGYSVGDTQYPAVSLDDSSFDQFKTALKNVEILDIPRGKGAVRKGYHGMRLLMGIKN